MISRFLQTLKVKNPSSSINQSMHNLESRFHVPVELILSPEIDMRALMSDDEDSCQEKASQPRFVFDEMSVVFCFHMSINAYLVDNSVDSSCSIHTHLANSSLIVFQINASIHVLSPSFRRRFGITFNIIFFVTRALVPALCL